jgi:hypothetical protein
VFNSDIDTLERAVKERVFFVQKEGTFESPPRPIPGHFEECMRDTLRVFHKLLPSRSPLTRSEFVQTFRGRKRKVYEKAYESLLRNSVSIEDSHVKVFVKREKTDHTRKLDPVPRVISPRSPRYNVELGRYLRPLEENIFKCIGELFGHRTVIKGMNSKDSAKCLYAKWSDFKRPVAVGLDASRFDQHVSVDALKFEHNVYLRCFPALRHKKDLAKLLSWQLKNKCSGFTCNGKLRYTIHGGRMSGDMNTSLGNCLLMCLMVYAYAKSLGVKVQLANNGDDCVVFMEQHNLPRFMAGLDSFFIALGFNMAVEQPCLCFEEIEFCQTKPVFVGPNNDDYIMVRHPKWAIAKDTVSIDQWTNEKMFKGWLHAVGTGGLSMTGRVPIFQEFYTMYLKSGVLYNKVGLVQSWGVRSLARDMDRGYGGISAATRASFYWAFDVTPDEQLAVERYYKESTIVTPLRKRGVRYQRQLPL